jgi:hypothetical protein
MGIMPRPRKMKPAHENTRFAVSGLRVEKVRIAVVCQQVCTASQIKTWNAM